jgi:hypothetical protein
MTSYSNGLTGAYSNTVNGEAPAATTPEPATFALVGAGLLGLGFLQRRK